MYTRFAAIGPGQWDAFRFDVAIARVTTDGAAYVTPLQPTLSRADLDHLTVFMDVKCPMPMTARPLA